MLADRQIATMPADDITDPLSALVTLAAVRSDLFTIADADVPLVIVEGISLPLP